MWKNNRPGGWGMPKEFSIRELVDGEWVDRKLHNNGARDLMVYEAGADAILKAIWKSAKESPTGTFTFDTHTISIY